MLDINNLIKYDKSNMHKVYDAWPEIAKEYYEKKLDKISFKGIEHIIFVGMGGSGAIGDVLLSIMSKTKMHLCVVKGYHLPKTADSNTLVVATSASGNTLETLTILTAAKKANCKIITFSSGGKMEKYCKKNKIEHRNIPILNSPRASFPAYMYSILNVLDGVVPIKRDDIEDSIKLLRKTCQKINSSSIHDNPSLEFAKWISGIPIIYYPMGLQSAAVRFKNSLQENAKIHAIAEDIIEACHNGIVSWERPSNVQPILIQGKDDYYKTKELWITVKEYFNKNKIEYRELYSINGNILSKIVNFVYLLDYASIYRALLSKIDPTPVNSIEYVKARMMG